MAKSNLLAGNSRLERLELLQHDEGHEGYLDALGGTRIPDPTTAGDFCRRFDEESRGPSIPCYPWAAGSGRDEPARVRTRCTGVVDVDLAASLLGLVGINHRRRRPAEPAAG